MIIPRYYQNDAIDAVYNYFMSHSGNPLIGMPTASGKSILPAIFFQKVMRQWPNQRFLLMSHVGEILKQNINKIQEVWPEAPLGIYSAQLKRKDTAHNIICGSIQSMARNPQLFGHRDMIWIDECFSSDTEILTDSGFVRFDQLWPQQKVAQYDLSTKQISFVEPIRKICKKPSSKMVHIETQNNFDLLLTENHEMLVTSQSGVWGKRKVKDITKAAYAKMTTAGNGIGEDNDLSPYERLVIAYQADGSAHKINNDNTFIAAFSFSKQRKIDEFLKLMLDGQFSFNEVSGKPSKNPNVKPRRRFMVYTDEPISKNVSSYFKLKRLSAFKARAIIDYMTIWDGHVATENVYLYTNTNKQSADFYQAVAVLCSCKTKMTKVTDDRKETFSDVYRLFITHNDCEISTQGFNPKEVEYSDDVHCVEVPTGYIVVRRNGKVLITGNCHLVSTEENSQYLSFLAIMKLINPFVKIVGMSATLYRMGQGMLTDNGLFTDICYDLTSMDGFNKLLAEGYLCPLIPFTTKTRLDVSDVGVQKGEYVATQLQGAVDKAEITFEALRELVHEGTNRRSWLIFSSGIDHAEHIAEQLSAFGIQCAPVHSKRPNEYNESALAAFKNYELQSIVSYSKITTGFDHVGVDLIGDLRPTISIPLHVQKYGRGMRPVYGEGFDLNSIDGRLAAIKYGPKPDCKVLDFSRNTARLGPVNDVRLPTKRSGKDGEVPIKICESCGAYNHISARICANCSAPFSFQVKIVTTASTEELIRSAVKEEVPQIETFNVLNATYAKHSSKSGKDTLKVMYYTTGLMFTEYVCLEHSGMAGKMARDWWRKRHKDEPPATIDAALLHIANLRCPRYIRVHVNKKYPEITGTEF